LTITGHSIELRVYAEDPKNNFLPDIGTLQTYKVPQGYGVRVDDSFSQGMEIPIYYDPMIAKLVTHGKDRQEAIERMIRAIDDYKITGIATTLEFGKFVMQHEAFRTGNFDTHFVKNHFKPEFLDQKSEESDEIAAVMATLLWSESKKGANLVATVQEGESAWRKNRKQ
jgi:acetyl-CoA carboxylase, biotin carboxylase subunit